MGFNEVSLKEFNINPFTSIGDQWMLVTGGSEEKFNTMTASWGGLGVLWRKNAATIYIRPQRYTKEFIDKGDTFTLSFFSEKYRSSLALCGKVSGREQDKVKEAGITPAFDKDGVYFEEADLVLICRKMYHDEIDPENFQDASLDGEHYPMKDYHVMYIGEILKVLAKE